jgi:hypothetical protein
MSEPLSERELIKLQIQAYEFYAGLIDRAVVSGAHDAKMPKWDDQLRQRLAELEATDEQALDAPGTTPIVANGESATS